MSCRYKNFCFIPTWFNHLFLLNKYQIPRNNGLRRLSPIPYQPYGLCEGLFENSSELGDAHVLCLLDEKTANV